MTPEVLLVTKAALLLLVTAWLERGVRRRRARLAGAVFGRAVLVGRAAREGREWS